MENYRANLGQLAIQGDQEYAAASQQATQNVQEAAAARGTVAARAAAAGVGGNSVEALLNEFSSIEATNAAALKRNLMWGNQARGDQARALAAGTQQQISSAAPNRIYGPSTPGYLATLAGIAMNSYGFYLQNKVPEGPGPAPYRGTYDGIDAATFNAIKGY